MLCGIHGSGVGRVYALTAGEDYLRAIITHGFYLLMILYFGGSMIWSHTRGTRTGSTIGEARLAPWGRDAALFGAVLAFFVLFLSLREIHGFLTLLALAPGGIIGALIGLHCITRWKYELRDQEHLPLHHTGGRLSWRSWPLWVWLGLLLILTPMFVPSRLPPLAGIILSVIWLWASAFFLVWGLCVWLWARKRE